MAGSVHVKIEPILLVLRTVGFHGGWVISLTFGVGVCVCVYES